jgi:hypothetical protein
MTLEEMEMAYQSAMQGAYMPTTIIITCPTCRQSFMLMRDRDDNIVCPCLAAKLARV